MKKIILPRSGGKTDMLIWQSSNSGDYIVCRDGKTVQNIARRAMDLGVKIPFPLSYDEFLDRRYYKSGIRGFLIDDANKLIEILSKGVPVNAITMRAEEGDVLIYNKLNK